jgi:hypothetical protein
MGTRKRLRHKLQIYATEERTHLSVEGHNARSRESHMLERVH